MSIMKLLGVRSWFLSFVEIVFFFCVLSVRGRRVVEARVCVSMLTWVDASGIC